MTVSNSGEEGLISAYSPRGDSLVPEKAGIGGRGSSCVHSHEAKSGWEVHLSNTTAAHPSDVLPHWLQTRVHKGISFSTHNNRHVFIQHLNSEPTETAIDAMGGRKTASKHIDLKAAIL